MGVYTPPLMGGDVVHIYSTPMADENSRALCLVLCALYDIRNRCLYYNDSWKPNAQSSQHRAFT